MLIQTHDHAQIGTRTQQTARPMYLHGFDTTKSHQITLNTRNQICFAFYTKWSDLLVTCFSMMASWYHVFMHSDADLVHI